MHVAVTIFDYGFGCQSRLHVTSCFIFNKNNQFHKKTFHMEKHIVCAVLPALLTQGDESEANK